MIQKLSIEQGTYELWFQPNLDDQTIDIFLFDIFNDSRTRLITWQGCNGKLPGGVWVNAHMAHKNTFFELTKKYRHGISMRLNKCKEYLFHNGEGDQSFSKTWKCFKRRVNIQIHKILK